MFAEGTVALFHVGKLVFILDEELVALVTLGDRHVRHQVLEVPLGVVGAEMAHVDDEHFFETHALQHILVYFNRLVAVRGHLSVCPLQHALSEQVVIDGVGVVVESHGLLLGTFLIFGPLILDGCTLGFTVRRAVHSGEIGWIHAQKLVHSFWVKVLLRGELNQRQLVEGDVVSLLRHATSDAVISRQVSQRVLIHAPVAASREAFLVREGLAADL